MAVTPKIKHRITFQFSSSACRYRPPRIESGVSKRYLYTHIHSSIIHNSQGVEATQVSINRWMNKQIWYIHTREYHTALKRKETLMQATTWINLENSMLREIKGQILYDSIYEILLLLFICWIPVQLFTTPWVAGLLCPSLSPGVCSNSCLLSWWCHSTLILCHPSPPALSLSQHQCHFQWLSSSYQVPKELELLHQSFQWIFRVDFL